ncbi:MAG TPA: hypothetical protein VIL65_13640 [Beijerinckiaceae bacterium]|jgi:hypothetical protein
MKVIYATTVAMAGLDVHVWKGAVMAEFSADLQAWTRERLEWLRR